MRSRLALALALAASTVAACQVVAGIERVEKVTLVEEPEAGADGGPDAAPVDPCAHALPPPPPEVDDDPDGALPPMYLAIRTLSFTARDEGFDLDGVCTCDERPGTAHGGASSCTPKQLTCDEEGGVDNRAAALFASVAGPSGGGSVDKAVNDGIGAGEQSLLIYVAGWNGKPNDREVYLGVMTSYGIVDGSGCGGGAGPYQPPQWCGRDKWTYSPDGAIVLGGEVVPFTRDKGYVTGGELVLRSDAAIPLLLPGMTLSFGEAILAGRLEATGSGYRLTGLLAGRVPVADMLATVGQLAVTNIANGEKEPVCAAPIFPAVKALLCDAVDIARTSAFDLKGGACDAISSVISFTAESAELGAARAAPADDSPCIPTGPDDPRYQCGS